MTAEIFYLIFSITVIFGGAWIGSKIGEGAERRRCMRLCNEAFRRRASGSVRLVAHAIGEGLEELETDEYFFGGDA